MKYVISQEPKSGAWYCHQKDYPNIPVFGSIGKKGKAREYCKMMNLQKHNVGKYEKRNDE